jgi:hypothetical protein
MRRAAWMAHASEVVTSLVTLRDIGVWQLRLTRPDIRPLLSIAQHVCSHGEHQNDDDLLVECTLRRAIDRLDRTAFRQAAMRLFDLDERHVASSTRRRQAAADEFGQALSTFRDPVRDFERPLLIAVAAKLEDLAISDQREALRGRTPVTNAAYDDVVVTAASTTWPAPSTAAYATTS